MINDIKTQRFTAIHNGKSRECTTVQIHKFWWPMTDDWQTLKYLVEISSKDYDDVLCMIPYKFIVYIYLFICSLFLFVLFSLNFSACVYSTHNGRLATRPVEPRSGHDAWFKRCCSEGCLTTACWSISCSCTVGSWQGPGTGTVWEGWYVAREGWNWDYSWYPCLLPQSQSIT